MANYNCTSRTNYFRVKDEAAFKAWADSSSLTVIKQGELVGLLPGDYTDDGSFPTYDGENDEEIDFMHELSKHLAPGQVAIRVEAGAEKSRYVVGRADAINANGEEVGVSIEEIYEKAKALGTVETMAEY